MKTNMFRKPMVLFLAIVMTFSLLPPITTNAESNWTLKSDTEIFWVDGDVTNEALASQVRLFSSELAEKVTGAARPITCGEQSEAGENDILLVLDNTEDIPAEGFNLVIENNNLIITASDSDGLFYGCRYLIKELLRTGSVSEAEDAPHVAERAVSLDNGRKYFTVAWIKELIREMSWANMNALVLHFSEDMGLGIESRLYPWLNGRDGRLCVQANVSEECDVRYLTQNEVAEIVEYAKLYHIEVIPSLDSPGHMNYIVRKFQEHCADQGFSFQYDGETYTVPAGSQIGNYYHYNGQTAVVQGSSVPKDTYALNTSRGIDISNEVATAFTKSLIEEYAKLFHNLGCTTFDIGGDELLGWGSSVDSSVSKWKQLDHWKAYAIERTGNSNAVAYDAFLLYMNDLNALVRELGYTSVRMWNDCVLLSSSTTGWNKVVELDTNIDIWYWTKNSNKYATYADAGYEVINILGDYNYYAMTSNYFSESRSDFAYSYADQIYNYWNPYEYNIVTGSSRDYAEWNDSRVLGGAFGIWCDNPTLRTEEQIMDEALPLIRANAAKGWYPGAHGLADYDTYTANWKTYGDAPAGTTAAPEIYTSPDLTALEAAVAEFETVDSTLYSAETYAAYTAAVDAGRALLTAEKPTQAQADAALKAIQEAKAALTETPKTDPTALNAAISAYEQTNSTQYTTGSFAVYTARVNAARNLLETGVYTQEDLAAALAAIDAARDSLVLAAEGVECIIGGSAQSTRVSVNKVATFTISTEKHVATTGLRVFDETGKEITATRSALNTRNTKRDIHTFIFKVTAADRGTHTYTVCVVLADGSLSADTIQITIQVR